MDRDAVMKIRVFLKYVVFVEAMVFAIISCFVLSDILLPYIAEPRSSGKIVVFDAEDLIDYINASDVVVLKEFTLTDLFSLPKIDSELIVLVVHGFNYSGEFALGTSEEPSIIYPFIHPLYVLDKAIVRGVTSEGLTRIGVTKEIIDYIQGEINASIVVITCGYPGITEEFAEKLSEKTRGFVAFSNKNISRDQANVYVRKIILMWRKGKLVEWLRDNSFLIYIEGVSV